MFRTTSPASLRCSCSDICAAPAAAQQTLSLNIGYFTLRGEADRVPGDTIVANLFADVAVRARATGFRISTT